MPCPVCRPAGAPSLELKYDIFGNGDEGTWYKQLEKYLQHKIVDQYSSNMPQTSLQTEEAFTVKEYKYKHTHTHTHTHKHTHIDKLNLDELNSFGLSAH